MELELEGRGGAVCPLCREAPGPEPFRCDACDVAYHPECRAELARCATLGCPGAGPAVQEAPATRAPRLTSDHACCLSWIAILGCAGAAAWWGPTAEQGAAHAVAYGFAGAFVGLLLGGLLGMLRG